MLNFVRKVLVLPFKDFFAVYQLYVITRTASDNFIRIYVVRIVRREGKHLGHINSVHVTAE